MEYQEIRTAHDVSVFDRESNGLHDGYLISMDYTHDGFEWGNPLFVDLSKARLALRIMVTSINNTLVEIVFEGVREFQIKEKSWDLEIVDSSVTLSKEGLVTWCTDYSTDPEILCNANYVIAKKMKWKIVL